MNIIYMRHTISSELPPMSGGHETLPILPSKEFDLNVFLESIAKEISSEDLESLKFMCNGAGGVPKSCLSEINSTLKLFRVLREKLVITRENLLTLQAMIWHIKRKDLYERFVHFCEKLGNTLYFFQPPDIAEEGHDHVKFHVRGYTVRSQEYLNRLREEVSKALCCPAEQIFVRGIEESNSLLITLMIPTLCIEILISLDNKKWCVLQSLDVDKFLIPRLDREIISPLPALASCNDDNPELQTVANKIKKFNFIEKPLITKGKEADDGKKEEKISKRRGHVGNLIDIPSDKHVHVSSGETIEGQIRAVNIEDDGKKEEKISKRRGHVDTLTAIPSDKPVHASSGETTEGQIRAIPVSPRTHADSGFQDVDLT